MALIWSKIFSDTQTTIIGRRLVVLGFLALAAATGATIVAVTKTVQNNLEQQAMTRVDTQMRVARYLLRHYGAEFSVKDGHLFAGTTILNGNMDLVDHLGQLVGGDATIFQDDRRIVTTIKKPNGEYALGTRLTYPPVRAAVIDAHQVYRGIANVVGREYYARYEPLLDAFGAQVGVIFVGVKVSEVSAAMAHGRAIILGTAAAALAIIFIGCIAIGRYLTRRILEREERLHTSYQDLEVALESMPNGLCRWSDTDQLVIANHRTNELLGLDPHVLQPGLPFRTFLQIRLAMGHFPGRQLDELYAERTEMMSVGKQRSVLERLPNGRLIGLDRRPVRGGGWLSTYEDVTEREHAEAKVAFMARHDALTALPNRMLFAEKLAAALAAKTGRIAILCLDLDGFKEVNDTYGHPVGDKLLKAVAGRLTECLDPGDTLARLGGDEFAIVQSAVDDIEGAATLARRILQTIKQRYEIDGRLMTIDVSVGIVVSNLIPEAQETLIQHADFALYRAKAAGGGTFCVFEQEMHNQIYARRSLEHHLRNALLANQLEVFYQPLVNVVSGTVSGFEALLRWHHPIRGLVSADDIIPIAEETGLIVAIGAWVLARACADAATWPDAIKVAVNISAIQFDDGTLVEYVRSVLDESGLAPARLELEITESVALKETDKTSAILHELRALGVRIALDDFGTGYSSLSYVRNFPFDKIKIDRSFVDGIGLRRDSSAIIRAVTGLASSLGIETVAEGVETREQLGWLTREGCNELQGYFFSVPRPAQDVPLMIDRVRAPQWQLELSDATDDMRR